MKPLSRFPLAIACLCAAACLGGCGFAVPPVLRYATADSTDLWHQGLRLHPAATPGFSFTTAYLEFSYEPAPGQNGARPIIFRVAGRNQGHSPALLDPVDFRLVPADSGAPMPAIDPENVLLAAERGKLAENASHADEAVADAFFDVPMIILDLGSALTEAPDERKEKERRKLEQDRRERDADREARHRRALEGWDGVRTEWSVNALRKTTLFAGMEAQGRVAFAVTGDATPPDTLVLQWKRPDGTYADLGRYGRPPLPKPEPKAQDTRRGYVGPAFR